MGRLDDMVQKTGRLTEKKLLSVFDKLCKAGWYQRKWRRKGLQRGLSMYGMERPSLIIKTWCGKA